MQDFYKKICLFLWKTLFLGLGFPPPTSLFFSASVRNLLNSSVQCLQLLQFCVLVQYICVYRYVFITKHQWLEPFCTKSWRPLFSQEFLCGFCQPCQCLHTLVHFVSTGPRLLQSIVQNLALELFLTVCYSHLFIFLPLCLMFFSFYFCLFKDYHFMKQKDVNVSGLMMRFHCKQ